MSCTCIVDLQLTGSNQIGTPSLCQDLLSPCYMYGTITFISITIIIRRLHPTVDNQGGFEDDIVLMYVAWLSGLCQVSARSLPPQVGASEFECLYS